MKELHNLIGRLRASIQGALDGAEMDAEEIIERSIVIEQLKEELSLVIEIENWLNPSGKKLTQQNTHSVISPYDLNSVAKHKSKKLK